MTIAFALFVGVIVFSTIITHGNSSQWDAIFGSFQNWPAIQPSQYYPTLVSFTVRKPSYNDFTTTRQTAAPVAPSTVPPLPPPVRENWSCNAGWTARKHSRKCYKVFAKTGSWKQSLDHCSAFGGLLALIDSRATQTFLAQLISQSPALTTDGSVFAWTGLSRIATGNATADYQWVMDKRTQDNYNIGFYKSSLPGAQIFNSRITVDLPEWAKFEPSFGADGCGALAAYNKASSNYFYFRDFDGKVFDLPCNNVPQPNSQPPNARANAAICEVRATNTLAEGVQDHEIHGDIIAPSSSPLLANDALSHDAINSVDWLVPQSYWPKGVVPYTFGETFTPVERNLILSQLRDIVDDAESCVSFVPRTSQLDYVKFIKTQDASCAARGIGRRGGEQIILIGPVCLTTEGVSHIKHEALHALGLPHEHQRYDRDNFVDVLEDNIIVLARSQFRKIDDPLLLVWQGFQYDFESIMHYPDNAFSYSPSNLKSIVAKQPSMNAFLQLTHRKMSRTDRAKLKQLYCNRRQSDFSTPTPAQTVTSISPAAGDRTLICVLQYWSFGKNDLPSRMAVSDTPPTLCTHIAYFSARVEDGKVEFAVGQGWNAEDAGAHYPKLVALRQQNPKLKIILVVQLGGGGNKWAKRSKVAPGKRRDATAAASPAAIATKIVEFCRQNNADGVMLAERERDNEPVSAGKPSPVPPAVAMLHEVRAAIDADVSSFGGKLLILMTSIAAPTLATAEALQHETVNIINKNADLVWLRPNRGGPQLRESAESGLKLLPGPESNMLASVEGVISRGVFPQKIVLSIDTSWMSYILDDETRWQPDAAIRADAQPHEWKLSAQKKGKDGTEGRVSYTELCLDMMRNVWDRQTTLSDASGEPYAARADLWVKYDTPNSVAKKVAYAQQRGLGGVAVTSLAFDDPHGYCRSEPFPLTKAAHDAMQLGPVDTNIRGAIWRRCLSFNGPPTGNSRAGTCEMQLTCGHFPRTSFSQKETDCVGLTAGSGLSCIPPSKSECFLNEAARKAVEARGGSLDGALVSTEEASGTATSITLNCNQYTPFKTTQTRYYFYCSRNYLNESSVDIFECPERSEFRLKRFACLAD